MKVKHSPLAVLAYVPVFLFTLIFSAGAGIREFACRINAAADRIAESMNSAQRFSMENDTLKCFLYKTDYRLISKYLVANDEPAVPRVEAITMSAPGNAAEAGRIKGPAVLTMRFTDNRGNSLPCTRILDAQLPGEIDTPVLVSIHGTDAQKPKTPDAPFSRPASGIVKDNMGRAWLDGNPVVLTPPKDSMQNTAEQTVAAAPPALAQVSGWASAQGFGPGQVHVTNLAKMNPPRDNNAPHIPPPPIAPGFNPSSAPVSASSSSLFDSYQSSKMYGVDEKPPVHRINMGQ
jgi:hypothetical protein